MREHLLGGDDERAAGRLAEGFEQAEQIPIGADAGSPAHAEGAVAPGDQEQQPGAAARDDVGKRVEAPVARRVGDREMAVIQDQDEAWRSPAWRYVRVSILIDAADQHHRRGRDQRPAHLVQAADVLAQCGRGRLLVERAQLGLA